MLVKTIQFTQPGKVEFVTEELDMTPKAGHVILKTECTLISPGTEMDVLFSRTAGGNTKYPSVMGYSAVAKVVAVGEGVTHVAVGDRCLCYHSKHRNYQNMPGRDVVKITSNSLASEDAVYCVVGCMGYQGVRRCRPEFGESMMVMDAQYALAH